MMSKDNLQKAINILSLEINNSKELWGMEDWKFNQLCQAQGILKVLKQRLDKDDRNKKQ